MSECNQCRRPLPADAVGGACPACLLGLARPGSGQAETLSREPDGSANPPAVADLQPHFPQFRIEALIGQGGMGAVYRAYQPNLERTVAIKIMAPRFAADPSFAERFAREAKTMARLNHQNIVNVYDYGQTDGLCYLVMEHVEGVNLRTAMRAGQLTAEQALAVVPQVCEALQFAHDEGIVHRDIKPENILVDRKGRVKIADFGLAKLVVEDQSRGWTLTGSRQVLGTVNYMAPEQIERPASVDHRADIYSLGVVLYELLTGELPLGRFQLPGEKFAGHAALDEVVVRTLEKSPDRRFQQASEVRSAVELARNSSGFRPLGPPRKPEAERAGAAGFAPEAPAANTPRSSRGPRVPFTAECMWHGLTATNGVLRLTRDHLLIEYYRRDTVFHSEWLGDKGTHQLPWDSILRMDLREGWYSHSIVLGLDSPVALKGLPTETPGTQKFNIVDADLAQARELVNAVRSEIGQTPLQVELDKPDQAAAKARRRLGWPAAGLILAGILNVAMLPIIVFLAYFVAVQRPFSVPDESAAVRMPSVPQTAPPASAPVQMPPASGPDEVAEIPASDGSPAAASESSSQPPATSGSQATDRGTADAAPAEPVAMEPRGYAESLNAVSTRGEATILNFALGAIYFVIGCLLIVGGYYMASLRHWAWCLAMAIVAIVPIHPGFLIGLPCGIWALVELSRPANYRQFG